jgi:hypothetical protein
MNPTQAPEVNEVAEMYGPTSAEEAASQSNPTQTTQVISDLIKSHVPRIAFEEGDNWLRFINPYRKPWYIAVGFYKMHTGDKVARVIHQEHFGQPNLFRLVQIQLYQNPETKPFMWTQDNPEGFRFDEQRRAFLVAARFENTLSPFGITQVTLGRTPRKGKPYRPSWGDALINLPTEKTIDPSNPAANGTLRWGSIFDPVKGRLVKCTLNNAGTINVTATFTPADRAMPLGQWEQREGAKCAFVPGPQYAEQLRNAPNLEESLVKLTADQQVDLIRTFLPAELWPHAERIITTALHGGARRSRTTATNAKPMTEVTQPSAGSTPAPTTQLPVPAEEPAEIAQPDQIYVAFVAKLGPKFRDIGEEIIRKLITRSLVTAGNMDTMANLPSDVLKSIAVAG